MKMMTEIHKRREMLFCSKRGTSVTVACGYGDCASCRRQISINLQEREIETDLSLSLSLFFFFGSRDREKLIHSLKKKERSVAINGGMWEN